MDFQEIKDKNIDLTPQIFLTAVLDQEQDKESTIIFSQGLEEQFEQNVNYLASDETISSEEILNWKENGFLIVAQTIDGDYIAGTLDQTLVIPISLYKSDMEIYDFQLPDFFINYTNGTLGSAILPEILE